MIKTVPSDLVDLVIEDPRWEGVPLADWAEAASQAALVAAGVAPQGREIALLACDDARIATLNADHRGKAGPTNVLSWPAFDLTVGPGARPAPPPPPGPMGESLGDIAIAWNTVATEAAAAGLPMRDHVLHLILHATLHLLGYDHESEEGAALMEGIETETLVRLGLQDPYSPVDPHEGSLFRLER